MFDFQENINQDAIQEDSNIMMHKHSSIDLEEVLEVACTQGLNQGIIAAEADFFVQDCLRDNFYVLMQGACEKG